MSDRTTSERFTGDFPRRTAIKTLGMSATVGLAGCGEQEDGEENVEDADPDETDSSSFDLIEASIPEIHEAMAEGDLTAESLTQQYLDRIDAYDEDLNAILYINDDAIERAQELDERLDASDPAGPLHGIPLLLKDNFNTGDMPTTGGSKTLEGVVPPEDATTVEKFREAGAIVLGKANMHEFAYGWETYSSMGGQTPEPYTGEHVSGGSSGGSAASVAANLTAVATGSDTCGSNRVPPAFTNTVGLRGTLGLISRNGIMPMSTAQDIAGPITRTIVDQAIMLDVMVGYDPTDPSTARSVGNIPTEGSPPITTEIDDETDPTDTYTESLDTDALDGATIGVVREYIEETEEGEPVANVMEAVIETMEDAGAEIVDPVSVPPDDNSVTGTEFRREMNRYLAAIDDPTAPETLEDIVADGENVHPNVLPTLENNLEVEYEEFDENVEYMQSLLKRDLYRDMTEVNNTPGNRQQILMEMADHDLDAILYPVASHPPTEIPEDEPANQSGVNCTLSAGTGLPSLSIPGGFTDDGLPVGIELMGRPFDEELLLALGYSYEQEAEVRRPPEDFGPIN